MKKVFFVLKGESQEYFTQQPNAESFAEKNGGEIFEEEISNKKFDELKTQNGFFKDLAVMEVKKNGSVKLPEKSEDLKKMVQQLQAENEKLKKVQNLSYQDAAALFKRKAELLSHIGKFETINSKMDDIVLKPTDDDELSTERYRVVLQGGYGYQKDEILGISNIFIITEFMQFIKDKVNCKIEALKAEVQQL